MRFAPTLFLLLIVDVTQNSFVAGYPVRYESSLDPSIREAKEIKIPYVVRQSGGDPTLLIVVIVVVLVVVLVACIVYFFLAQRGYCGD